jgi:hypothetical protein
VARTEAIGSGAEFNPRVVSVLVAIAPATKRSVGYEIMCPKILEDGIALYFQGRDGSTKLNVFICNGGDIKLSRLKVDINCFSSDDLDISDETSASYESRAIDDGWGFRCRELQPRTGVLIDTHDLNVDGDCITMYAASFEYENEYRSLMYAVIGPGGSGERFILLSA